MNNLLVFCVSLYNIYTSIFTHSLNKYLLNIYCVLAVFPKLLIQRYTKEMKIPGRIEFPSNGRDKQNKNIGYVVLD